MGGRFALLALGRFADRFRAAASLHGTALVGQSEQSPHKIAAAGIGEVYCGFAERDPHGSAEVVAAMDRSFAASKVAYSYLLHRGAEHGYALPDRDIHDAGATERDWTAILAMFARQLTSDRQRV
jgi:carboxymethylenebutenolidase